MDDIFNIDKYIDNLRSMMIREERAVRMTTFKIEIGDINYK